MRRLFVLLMLAVTCTFSTAADVEPQLITTKLAHGASVGIPETWDIIRGTELQAIETDAAKVGDLVGNPSPPGGFDTLIAANFPDPDRYASIAISSTAHHAITPEALVSATDADLKEMQAKNRRYVTKFNGAAGVNVWGWSPLRKTKIGKYMVLHTSYLVSSKYGPHRLHNYKYSGRGRLFDILVSTNTKDEEANSVIIKRILASIVFP